MEDFVQLLNLPSGLNSYADEKIADNISIRFGIFTNAGQETDMEERFERARIAADRVKNDTQTICGFYDLE